MEDLIYRLNKRAEIRRSINTRKSVQNNEPDRIADLLEEAADRIAELEKGLELVKDAYCAKDSECKQLKERIAELEKEKWMTEIEAKQQGLKQIIDMLVLEHDTLACTSYPMQRKEK